jgi:hypothetical protein
MKDRKTIGMKIAQRVVKAQDMYVYVRSYTITKLDHTAHYPIQLSKPFLLTSLWL